MDEVQRTELTRLLAALRREGRQQSGLDPELIPPDRETAYDVAHRVEEELGWAVAGWKIAATNTEMQQALRTDQPIYGRVYTPNIHPSPATSKFETLCSPIPEVEFQVRLGSDLPPREMPYSLEEVSEAVASLHPGIELAECRFSHDENFPPLPAILADGSGSATLIFGPAIENWEEKDIAGQVVTLYCDDYEKRCGTAKAAMEHPMVPLTWLANELSLTGIGMVAGQMISTGTLTGMLRPKRGQTYRADFGPFGEVIVNLE
tara:strand:+ start:28786 stop:29571 length:786 start_codon:yes stop_codon:yes gene_type:complete